MFVSGNVRSASRCVKARPTLKFCRFKCAIFSLCAWLGLAVQRAELAIVCALVAAELARYISPRDHFMPEVS